MSELYAITVRLPWAAAIRDGVKRVENRGRRIPEKYVGQRVAIHAAAAWAPGPMLDRRVLEWVGPTPRWAQLDTLRSRVLAVATIAGCHQAAVDSGFRHCCAEAWGDRLYRPFVHAFHIALADVVALPEPVGPVRGQLQVPWRLSVDDARRVLDQVPGVSGV